MATERARRIALAGSAALAIAWVFAYPGSSLDVFKYIADTRTLTVYHQNPLEVAPIAHTSDPMFPAIPPGQQRQRAFYGPAFYVVAAPASLIAGSGFRANLIAFKLLNTAAFALLVLVVAGAVRRIAPARVTQAIVVIGWNPYLLFEGIGNAHNDVLMVAFCLTGMVLAARGRPLAGVGLWALGAAVKYVTALTAPVLFLWLWRRSEGRARLAIGASAAAVTLAGLALFLADPRRIRSLGIFNRTAFRTPYAVLIQLLGAGPGSPEQDAARYFCLAVFATVVALVLWRLKQDEASLYRGAFWVLAAASAFTVSYSWPWYLLWFVPFGALLVGSVEANVAIVASVVGLLATGFYPYPDQVNLGSWIVGLLYGVPLLAVPATWLVRSRRKLPAT